MISKTFWSSGDSENGTGFLVNLSFPRTMRQRCQHRRGAGPFPTDKACSRDGPRAERAEAGSTGNDSAALTHVATWIEGPFAQYACGLLGPNASS